MNHAETFLARLPEGAPAHLAEDVRLVFGTVSTARGMIAKACNNRNLSPMGQNIEIAKALADGPLGYVEKTRQTVDRRLSDAIKQRSVLRERVQTEGSFSETRKQEVRAWLRTIPLARKNELVKSGDELIRESIIGAPHYLSDLPVEVWGAVVDSAVADRFGDAMAQIDTLEKSYTEAKVALTVAEGIILREAEIAPALAAE